MTTAFRISGEILEYIKTGGWITIEETSGQVGIAPEKSIKILDFLSEFWSRLPDGSKLNVFFKRMEEEL